ncbi:hypothetical protein CAOG_008659 [Capsaspora owczarzaki ATCC 30864]|uniref:Myb-like domain-containing protein n=1 Tax=Capsaspora owczarzaki (strain ATCC 30864) TaxID=595528 RepID=A0A0D2UAC3_CAPO3|nr:hypothetical protein CAOG_008659 [Capsaspora owczarzaki ATCC 30864]
MSDVRNILDLEGSKSEVLSLIADKAPRGHRSTVPRPEKPAGMSMEVYRLYLARSSAVPTDTTSQGYVQHKARLGNRRAVQWRMTEFTNPARQDELVLRHWCKAADADKEYKFAKWNRAIVIPEYSDEEYATIIETTQPGIEAFMPKYTPHPSTKAPTANAASTTTSSTGALATSTSSSEAAPSDSASAGRIQLPAAAAAWTKPDTDHLFALCADFDLRFAVIAGRYEGSVPRTVEELKDRFYSVCNRLAIARARTAALAAGVTDAQSMAAFLARQAATAASGLTQGGADGGDMLPDVPLEQQQALYQPSQPPTSSMDTSDDTAASTGASSAGLRRSSSSNKPSSSLKSAAPSAAALAPTTDALSSNNRVPGVHLIFYDADHEVRRKLQLERMLHRTYAQIREEEFLIGELRKIESRGREREKERESASRIMKDDDAGRGPLVSETTKKKKKKSSSSRSSTAVSAAGASSAATGASGASLDAPEAVAGPYDPASSSAAAAAAIRRERPIGTHLRSSRFAPLQIGTKAAKRIDLLLEELGANVRFMPTLVVCDEFDELRAEILGVLDLKKVLTDFVDFVFLVVMVGAMMTILIAHSFVCFSTPMHVNTTSTCSSIGDALCSSNCTQIKNSRTIPFLFLMRLVRQVTILSRTRRTNPTRRQERVIKVKSWSTKSLILSHCPASARVQALWP